MKFVLLLFTFLAFMTFPCLGKCQAKLDLENPNRDPGRGGLRNMDKQRTLFDGKTYSLNAHFNYTRAVFPIEGQDLLTRRSSYILPVLLNRRIGKDWAAIVGPFAGINRSNFQSPFLLQSEAPIGVVNHFTYGLLTGISRRITDQLSFQLRYRMDLCGEDNAWQPLQLGWSLKF